MLYAKQILDKNHNGLLSVQEASKDLTFQGMIGGNLSLILTQQNLQNDTISPKPEYNPNNDTYINIETELKPALIERAKSFPFPSHHHRLYQHHQINVSARWLPNMVRIHLLPSNQI